MKNLINNWKKLKIFMFQKKSILRLYKREPMIIHKNNFSKSILKYGKLMKNFKKEMIVKKELKY